MSDPPNVYEPSNLFESQISPYREIPVSLKLEDLVNPQAVQNLVVLIRSANLQIKKLEQDNEKLINKNSDLSNENVSLKINYSENIVALSERERNTIIEIPVSVALTISVEMVVAGSNQYLCVIIAIACIFTLIVLRIPTITKLYSHLKKGGGNKNGKD
jgi:hypothetical protein